jgi:Domain of unknown function (DUF4331)/HupE / UreJ protein
MNMKRLLHETAPLVAAAGLLLAGASTARASSHMDAPLITLDDAANTTDVYAFVRETDGVKSLVTALGVYPFEEPGIGPNKYNFDDNVLYEIHVATGDDVAAGRPTISYQFTFETRFKNKKTILQSYLGVINDVDDAAQNLTQFYKVTKLDHRTGRKRSLGRGVVPPNNQGNATPFYNQGDNGENPAKDGVATFDELDRYTKQSIARLDRGYVAFAGQRDDGFYADIQSVFDLLRLRNPGKDSQGGFNLHLMALAIPVDELGGDRQVAGVYATTSRKRFNILADGLYKSEPFGDWVQVARQGNPLFNEGLVAIEAKDLYSRTSPSSDAVLFRKTAFTVAHSITLALAGLDLVQAPAGIVEPLIAASIVFVGVENVLRGPTGARWKLAFGFGLVHGFGFAAALREIGLGGNSLAVVAALGSFNAGVEAGQIAVAIALWPLVRSVRSANGQRLRLVPTCSGALTVAGVYWFIERTMI